ncbi:Transposon Tf2-11 polyprotein [Dictyocoela muelleri]|nr:Transposon Tf2-11 polyprotein [Dictyocoela muelleri]
MYNSKIYILTDNKNLTFIGELTKRIERWKLTIEEYDYTLLHVNGSDNEYADSLSRLYLIPNKTLRFDEHLLEININTLDKIKRNLNLKYKNTNETCFEISNEFIRKIHDDLVHPGYTKLIMTLKNYFQIPNMRKIIDEICSKCHICNISKDLNNKTE